MGFAETRTDDVMNVANSGNGVPSTDRFCTAEDRGKQIPGRCIISWDSIKARRRVGKGTTDAVLKINVGSARVEARLDAHYYTSILKKITIAPSV